MSSIHFRKDTGKWVVRWREGGRAGRQRSRSFDLERHAKRWKTHVDQAEQLGQLAHIDAGKVTMGELVEDYWRLQAVPNLAPSTRAVYRHVWTKHARPRLAGYRARDITPAVLTDLRATLARKGVGDPTIVKALTMLQAVFSFAVVRGVVPVNPMDEVRKPRQARTREIVVLAPASVERLRAEIVKGVKRDTTRGEHARLAPLRDSVLVTLLAYAGPRPDEALALEWRHVGRRVLRFYAPKTRKERTVNLFAPLARDLAELRMAAGRPHEREPVFPRRSGHRWSETDLRNWRRRIFRPAAEKIGHPKLRPYDLRHSFVSLLIHEGQSVVEVARQAGHSPQTCLSTYAHVFDEFDPAERVSAEAAIRAAREGRGSVAGVSG